MVTDLGFGILGLGDLVVYIFNFNKKRAFFHVWSPKTSGKTSEKSTKLKLTDRVAIQFWNILYLLID